MRLDNYTTIETPILKEIIKHCLPPGVAGFDITFKNCSDGFRGRAYVGGCSYHDASKGRRANGKRAVYVVIGVSKKHGVGKWSKPYIFAEGRGNGAYLEVKAFSAIEATVYLVGHELRHLWQTRVPRGRRVYGARGQYSERDACAYGIQKLREWRRK